MDYVTLYAAHPDTVSEAGVSIGRSLASSTSAGRQGSGISLDGMTRISAFGNDQGVGTSGIESFNSIHQHGR